MTDSPSDRGPDAASERDRLLELVEVWHDAATRASALLRSLDAADWSRPTDLPGWDVRAVAGHLAHLESELAGFPQQQVEVPEAPHVRGLMGQFTEAGPVARAGWSTDEIVDELDRAVAHRYNELVADPPTDGSAPGPGFAGLIGWSWETLLSNRPLDLWMHEQDIRRAVGRPGGFDSPAATHVVGVFLRSLPYVLGKKAGAEPGQSVRLVVTGREPADVTAIVGEDGRGTMAPPSTEPTATVELDAEAFVVRCGGRRAPEDVPVTITGDPDLARRVLAGLATTP
jgi:uncharacterized protein (TIGR03083 family)